MDRKIHWGILGTATIALEQVIPALLKCEYGEVTALASRNKEKAKKAAAKFNIPKYFGDYQELMDDAEVEAVYIPLPNHLHVEWAIKALRSGKHVLVEKPIAMGSLEARRLLEESKRHPELKIMEALMYKFHPQWIMAEQLLSNGEIGKLRNIQSCFSFYDDNPESIVNSKPYGGGSLMDIGCYSISLSRLLFGCEPKSVVANMVYDPKFEVDIFASGILEFDRGSSSFFCATQMAESQQVMIFGTEATMSFELPFNPPNDRPAKIYLTKQGIKREIVLNKCDQYTLQADALSLAIMSHKEVPLSLEDAIKNMIVIEKMRESDALGRRISLA